MKLNLGCGHTKLLDYINVDVEPEERPDVLLDIAKAPWPWPDSSVTEAVASHVLEHIGDGFFHVIKELYRVCAPGALIRIEVPHPRSDLFLNDPTHVRPVTPTMMLMFSKAQWEFLESRGQRLTPFWKYLNVDFKFHTRMAFDYHPSVDLNDPELDWKIVHLNNIVQSYRFTIEAIK